MLMDDIRLPIVNTIISPVSLRGHGIVPHNASLIPSYFTYITMNIMCSA